MRWDTGGGGGGGGGGEWKAESGMSGEEPGCHRQEVGVKG